VGQIASDGRPFTPDETQRLEQALSLLLITCLDTRPLGLTAKQLRRWHRTLSAEVPRMSGGVYRSGDVVFGSLFGLPPHEIAPAIGALLSRHHQWVRRVGSDPDDAAVTLHGTYLHAELIRVHPFADGNGRLARLVQAWLSLSFGHFPPDYPPEQRPAYYSALSRYCLYRDLEPLMALNAEEPT